MLEAYLGEIWACCPQMMAEMLLWLIKDKPGQVSAVSFSALLPGLLRVYVFLPVASSA